MGNKLAVNMIETVFFIYKAANLFKMYWLFIIASWFFCPCLFSKDRTPCYPYITGDAFRAFSDHIFDEDMQYLDVKSIGKGDVVFVNADYLDGFFLKYHPLITNPYILITHNSDVDITNKYAQYLDDDLLIMWFGQNVFDYQHAKLIPIPIGLTNRYNPLGDPANITSAINKLKTLRNGRPILAYLNASIHTNITERKKVYDVFFDKRFCKKMTKWICFNEYLKYLSSSKFVISPRGNGLDCHRTWEALYLGAIPIIKKSKMDSVFDGLPVLVVDKWEEISEELLINKYKEIRACEFDFSKLYIDYWLNLISVCKKNHINKFNE